MAITGGAWIAMGVAGASLALLATVALWLWRARGRLRTSLAASESEKENVLRELETRDATCQRLEATARLREAEQSREHAAVEARTRFLATLSHELRTPLNGVIGYLDLLDRTTKSGRQGELMDGARTSAQHMLELINDFLDFAKIEAGNLEIASAPFSLKDTLDQVRAVTARAAAEKGLSLSIDVHPNVPDRVAGDSLRVRQVLLNLLSNAVKFTRHGRIRLRVRPGAGGLQLQPATTIWFDDGQPNTYVGVVEFEVEDEGAGISPDQLQRIFDPFKQANARVAGAHGGTGLGLAISRELARTMGGDLTVTSEVGVGSTFRFHVAFSSAEQVDTPVSLLPAAKVDRALRVLLVDDNAVNRLVGSQLLRALGHHADTAEDGLAGVERATSASYDVIIMDMEMPRLDGLGAARRLRELGHAVPILGFTAHSDSKNTQLCYDAGMNAVVHKPLSLDKLGSALAHVVARRGNGRRRDRTGTTTEVGAEPGVPTATPPPPTANAEAPAEAASARSTGRLARPSPSPDLARTTDDVPRAPEPAPTTPAARPAESLFDVSVLVGRVGGDEALAAEVLAAVVSDSERIMREIDEALAARDLELLRRAAHTLKGCVANVSAVELSAKCAELERRAKDGDASGADAITPEVRELFARVHAGLSVATIGQRAA